MSFSSRNGVRMALLKPKIELRCLNLYIKVLKLNQSKSHRKKLFVVNVKCPMFACLSKRVILYLYKQHFRKFLEKYSKIFKIVFVHFLKMKVGTSIFNEMSGNSRNCACRKELF